MSVVFFFVLVLFYWTVGSKRWECFHSRTNSGQCLYCSLCWPGLGEQGMFCFQKTHKYAKTTIYPWPSLIPTQISSLASSSFGDFQVLTVPVSSLLKPSDNPESKSQRGRHWMTGVGVQTRSLETDHRSSVLPFILPCMLCVTAPGDTSVNTAPSVAGVVGVRFRRSDRVWSVRPCNLCQQGLCTVLLVGPGLGWGQNATLSQFFDCSQKQLSLHDSMLCEA